MSRLFTCHTKRWFKAGVDDWLADGHTVEELEKLVDAPRPVPETSKTHRRTFGLVRPCISQNHFLLSMTMHMLLHGFIPKLTQKESANKNGEIIRHDPP